jgi:hypothetical protein
MKSWLLAFAVSVLLSVSAFAQDMQLVQSKSFVAATAEPSVTVAWSLNGGNQLHVTIEGNFSGSYIPIVSDGNGSLTVLRNETVSGGYTRVSYVDWSVAGGSQNVQFIWEEIGPSINYHVTLQEIGSTPLLNPF